MERASFSFKTLYDMIVVLKLCEYLQLLAEGGLKEKSATKSVTPYIRFINNSSVEWFARQLKKCGNYFVKHKKLLVIKQGFHKKFAYYIGDEDICSVILVWLQIQNLPQ